MNNLVEPPKAAGKREAQAIQKHLLGRIGLGDTTQPDSLGRLPMVGHGREEHVAALDLGQLFQQRSGSIAQARPTHPLPQRLPEHIRQKADENVGQDPILRLMKDGADLQLVLGNPEGPLRLR